MRHNLRGSDGRFIPVPGKRYASPAELANNADSWPEQNNPAVPGSSGSGVLDWPLKDSVPTPESEVGPMNHGRLVDDEGLPLPDSYKEVDGKFFTEDGGNEFDPMKDEAANILEKVLAGVHEVRQVVEAARPLVNTVLDAADELIKSDVSKVVGRVYRMVLEAQRDVKKAVRPEMNDLYELDASQKFTYIAYLMRAGFTREEAMDILLQRSASDRASAKKLSEFLGDSIVKAVSKNLDKKDGE